MEAKVLSMKTRLLFLEATLPKISLAGIAFRQRCQYFHWLASHFANAANYFTSTAMHDTLGRRSRGVTLPYIAATLTDMPGKRRPRSRYRASTRPQPSSTACSLSLVQIYPKFAKLRTIPGQIYPKSTTTFNTTSRLVLTWRMVVPGPSAHSFVGATGSIPPWSYAVATRCPVLTRDMLLPGMASTAELVRGSVGYRPTRTLRGARY